MSPKHLKNAFLDGEFILPYHWPFWSNAPLDTTDTICTGQRVELCAETVCKPIRLSKGAKAILLRATEAGKDCYAWFHAEDMPTRRAKF